MKDIRRLIFLGAGPQTPWVRFAELWVTAQCPFVGRFKKLGLTYRSQNCWIYDIATYLIK
jgi:hypothetical protein